MSTATPPGFGNGKPWVLRTFEYETSNGRFVVLLQRGMPVADHLHEFYHKEVEFYGDLIEAGVTLSDFGVTSEGHLVAAGKLDPTDGPDEVAWIACMFAEIGLGNLAFEMPEGVDLSAVRGGRLGVVVGKEAAGG